MFCGPSRSRLNAVAKSRRYLATLGEQRLAVATPEDRERLLNQIQQQAVVDLLVERERAHMVGFERLVYSALGLGTKTDEPCVSLLRSGEHCALTFLTPSWGERRALDPARKGMSGRVAFTLSTGESTSLDLSECLGVREALAALSHFLEHGKRPGGLSYVNAN